MLNATCRECEIERQNKIKNRIQNEEKKKNENKISIMVELLSTNGSCQVS